MKLYSLSIAGFIAILFGASCSKKNDPVIPPCLITNITMTSIVPGSVFNQITNFEYDGNFNLVKSNYLNSDSGLLFKSSFTSNNYYFYTDGHVSRVTSTNSTGDSYDELRTNEGGRVTKITSTGNDTAIRTALFLYDGNGRLDSMHSSTTSPNVATLDFSFVYNSSGNLLSDKIDLQDGANHFSYTSIYSGWDTNNNPYDLLAKSMGQLNFLYFDEVEPANLFKGNPSSEIVEGMLYNYVYEFNAAKYPTKITRTGPNSDVLTTVFTYKNCE